MRLYHTTCLAQTVCATYADRWQCTIVFQGPNLLHTKTYHRSMVGIPQDLKVVPFARGTRLSLNLFQECFMFSFSEASPLSPCLQI